MKINQHIYGSNFFLRAGVVALLEKIFTDNSELECKNYYFLLFSDLSLTDIPYCCRYIDKSKSYIVVGDLKLKPLLYGINHLKIDGFVSISLPLAAMHSELFRLIKNKEARRTPFARRLSAHLTFSERNILRYISKGLTPASIATWTGVSVKTVSTHKRNIMRKLNVSTNQQLYIKALLLQQPDKPINC